MTTIKVTYEVDLPDDVDAVGGVLVYEGGSTAIANIQHTDGTVSAWAGKRDFAWQPHRWERCQEGGQYGDQFGVEYTVVNNQWRKA
jgi:hypothetical protein